MADSFNSPIGRNYRKKLQASPGAKAETSPATSAQARASASAPAATARATGTSKATGLAASTREKSVKSGAQRKNPGEKESRRSAFRTATGSIRKSVIAGKEAAVFSGAASSAKPGSNTREKARSGANNSAANSAGKNASKSAGKGKSTALTASTKKTGFWRSRSKNKSLKAVNNSSTSLEKSGKLFKTSKKQQKKAETANPIITPEVTIPRTRGKNSRFASANPPVIKNRVNLPSKPVSKPGRKDNYSPRGGKVIPAQVQQKLTVDKRKHKRKRLLQSLALLVVLAAATWGVGFSPLLALKMEAVKIEGANEYYPLNQAQEVVQKWEGYSLLRLRSQSLKTALTQANPWLQEIELERDYPHGLTLKLKLRQAVVRSGDGFLDTNGVKLPRMGAALDYLPVYESKCEQDTASSCTTSALEVLAVLPEDLKNQLGAISAHSRKNIVLTLNSGTEIVWGASENNQQKLKVLQVLFQRPAQVYNISDYGHPLVK